MRYLPCYLGHPHRILSPLDAGSGRNLSQDRVAETMRLHSDDSLRPDMQYRSHSSAVFPATLPIVPPGSREKAAIVKSKVSSKSKRTVIEVRVEVLNCSDNCQRFAPCTVIAFRFTECTALVGYDSFLAIVNLRRNCPYANITGISV